MLTKRMLHLTVAFAVFILKLEIGLATKYPMLMAIGDVGNAVYDDGKAPEEIRDMAKVMAQQQYPNGTVVSIRQLLPLSVVILAAE
jgi:hypothetical protein